MRLSPKSKDSGHVMMSSCVRLLSIPSPSLLKPAWADNKIRVWRGSLATWPKKQQSFISKAAADRHDWGKGGTEQRVGVRLRRLKGNRRHSVTEQMCL